MNSRIGFVSNNNYRSRKDLEEIKVIRLLYPIAPSY